LKIHRIASTVTDLLAMEDATNGDFDPFFEEVVSGPDLLAEFAGRACYQSWGRPNPTTRSNKDYIRSTIHEKGHESITAHASVTYYITGVSRALTHELLRHRWLAFSELSQRYVPADRHGWVYPPALKEFPELQEDLDKWMAEAKTRAIQVAERLKKKGFSTKQAREAARAFLPNATETRIVVTGNLRAWRDFIRQRWSVHADREIRELAGGVLDDLRKLAPNVFADIPETPYGAEDA